MDLPHPTAGRARWAQADTIKTALLLCAIGGVAAGVGYVLLGGGGLLLGALVAGFMASASLRISPAFVMRLNGGVPLSPWTQPGLRQMVDRLSQRAGIRPPQLYLIEAPHANAMASGSSDAGALGVTLGAMHMLSPLELEGVLAHEIAHLKHGDTRVMLLSGMAERWVSTMLRVAIAIAAISAVVSGGRLLPLMPLFLLAMAAPTLVGWLRAVLSRTREFAADRTAAHITGRPLALASALAKLEQQRHWMAHGQWRLWLPQRRDDRDDWLRSHPATDARIERLKSVAGYA